MNTPVTRNGKARKSANPAPAAESVAEPLSLPAEAEPEAVGEEPALPPRDAAAWRAALPTLPPREVLRVIGANKMFATRVFAGFRLGVDALKNPVVHQRIAEAAVKIPKLAEELAAIQPEKPAEVKAREPGPSAPEPVTAKPTVEAAPAAPDADYRLRDKVKEQRAALRDKDRQIAAAAEELARTVRERNAARAEAEAARAELRAAEAEAERQQRQRDRDNRRESRQNERATESATRPPSAAISAAPPAPASASRLLEEALHRLLRRGRYAVAIEICREALSASGVETLAGNLGRVHALYATALYGSGALAAAEEQDRLAARFLMDAADLVGATEALGRIITHVPALRAATITPLLRRLFALAERLGRVEAVQDVLTHVRIASPEANRRLQAALSGNEVETKSRSLLRRLSEPETATVGPNEAIALPSVTAEDGAVTPQSIVRAVESGDAAYIVRVRSGIRALQSGEVTSARALARALLAAVAQIDASAGATLSQPTLQPVVVDASNVARHNPDPLALIADTPRHRTLAQIERLRQMRDYLLRLGFFPVVMIADASLRFHIDDRAGYQELVDRGIVREAQPGTSADEALISEARHHRAPLITNDRLTEWGERGKDVERLNFVLLATGASLTPI